MSNIYEELDVLYNKIEKIDNERKKLQKQISKAIEYIDEHTNNGAEYIGAWEAQDLRKILKGVDKE